MAFGREWDNERELAFKNNGDAEKMLELYIYNHMKKKNLHDVANFFAKEANIETPKLMEIEENFLTEWWQVFWPALCSTLSNKVKVNIVTEEKYMVHGNERDVEEMLHLYIYHYMKKRELHEGAKIFAEKANIEMLELLDYDESLLKDWWDVFWPRFFSRITKQPERNPQSSVQPSMGESIEMLASSILDHSASKEKGKGPLGFPPVKLLPAEITLVPHSDNFSHLQMPSTIQSPPQVVEDHWSVQLESAYPAGQDSAYPPAAPIIGESYRKNQGILSGVGVNEPDGPTHDSLMSHVPPAFSEFMQQEAKEWGCVQNHHSTSLDSTK